MTSVIYVIVYYFSNCIILRHWLLNEIAWRLKHGSCFANFRRNSSKTTTSHDYHSALRLMAHSCFFCMKWNTSRESFAASTFNPNERHVLYPGDSSGAVVPVPVPVPVPVSVSVVKTLLCYFICRPHVPARGDICNTWPRGVSVVPL